jgi:hypothetical protein
MNISKNEEAALSTEAFKAYFEALKQSAAADLPVTFQLTNPKGMTDSMGEERTRLVGINKYQNGRVIALPFYKAISTVIHYRKDD